ncbi:PPE family protein [Mycobacterium sp. M1]|uniref:PPE family protein n=1 Tax=Mycolicibacter acidiphilus TaxID=2835306 RepID=A0ABS5RI00_9MYCO|nr:PPE family protein [Mycolicibacter acidiphilus]MBS9533927.1 PPE family protein [Mycolicibacter acidiphilus]
MTAPIWMASPPEVHSTLLSAGPGAGPLLSSAAAWSALGIEYDTVADELTALLAAVQSGSWQGPSAAAFAAANAPYLAWLSRAAANATVTSAQQQVAAGAYTAALAAMPTLAELAANHATHTALLATNFLGINTIPIALNEADYLRMWVQAATVMGTYQAVAGSAAAGAAAARTEPAPAIAKAGSAESSTPPVSQKQDVLDFLNKIGYTDWYNKYILPLGNPQYPGGVGAIDPYLGLEGNPLFYINPLFLAQAFGEPIDLGTFIAFQSGDLAYAMSHIGLALATGNPLTIMSAVVGYSIQVISLLIINTMQLLHYLIQQTVALIPAILPLLTAPLVPLVAAPLPGLAGLAGLAALPTVPVVPMPATPPLMMGPPASPTPAPAPAPPAPAPAPSPAPAPAPGAPPPAPPPTPAGPPTVGMPGYLYMVGGLNAAAKRAAGTSARKRKAPEPDGAEEAAAAPAEQAKAARRRRRAKDPMLGRGHEYMDLTPEPVPAGAAASQRGAGRLGFTGRVAVDAGERPVGLTTLTDGSQDGGATIPMLPGSWESGPE